MQPVTHGILFLCPSPQKKIPSHLQDSISGFSWNVVKICVFAMGTFRSRGLGGSSYKTVCLKLYFCTKWIFIRPVNSPLMCVSEPERSKAPCGKCSHPPATFVLSPHCPPAVYSPPGGFQKRPCDTFCFSRSNPLATSTWYLGSCQEPDGWPGGLRRI